MHVGKTQSTTPLIADDTVITQNDNGELDKKIRSEAKRYRNIALISGTMAMMGTVAFIVFFKNLAALAALATIAGFSITPVGLVAIGLGILVAITFYYGHGVLNNYY